MTRSRKAFNTCVSSPISNIFFQTWQYLQLPTFLLHFKNSASFLLEEIVAEIVLCDLLIIESGSADSFFNSGVRTLLMSKDVGRTTYKEIELLRAASTKCHVRIPICIIYHFVCFLKLLFVKTTNFITDISISSCSRR